MYPKVVNGDPDCKYCLVYSGQDGLIERYKANGWDIVYWTQDGPRLSIGKTCKPNEAIEYQSHTLMDCHKDDFADIQSEGQKYWDHIEDAMIDKEGGPMDKARGMKSRALGIPVLNETKPNVRGTEIPEEREDG